MYPNDKLEKMAYLLNQLDKETIAFEELAQELAEFKLIHPEPDESIPEVKNYLLCLLERFQIVQKKIIQIKTEIQRINNQD